MPWPKWDTETTGTGGRVAGANWNDARSLPTLWLDKPLSASAINIAGDGKYRVTYSGAQNLDTINETGGDNGYLVILKADRSGAGGNLTVRNGIGNIFTNHGVNIVLANDQEWAMFVQHGSAFYGIKMYEAA